MASAVESITTSAAAERRARQELAAAHRLAYRFGWNDGIYNHFTLTLPGRTDQFLVKPHGVLMSEVTASNLILVDAAGRTVAGEGKVETTALHIHAAIHMTLPAATCVLHIHPPYSTWLTCLEENRLRMCTQTATRFYDRIAYDDEYAGLALARDEGLRMAKALGNRSVMMHANHGVTTIGPTVAHAFFELHYLEKACSEYYRIVAAGSPPRTIPDRIAAKAAGQMDNDYEEAVDLLFAAFKRTLDKEEPDYAM
jgi:ribulose-5-phosphate 4-epimerase/fuculose-1-phosphate aldolase